MEKKKPDQDMAEHFFNNREEFKDLNRELRQLQEKGLFRIDDSWTSPADLTEIGISDSKLKELRKKMESLDIPRGVYTYKDGTVEYLAYTHGLSIGGSSKGYFYSEAEPENYFTCDSESYQKEPYDLGDKPEDFGECIYVVYTEITDSWYIIEEHDD
jgi:hypothetical protein